MNGYVAHMWAKLLDDPCHLGGPQRSVRGQKSGMAMGLTRGQSGYITLAVLGVGDKNEKWERGPHVGTVDTLPLPS